MIPSNYQDNAKPQLDPSSKVSRCTSFSHQTNESDLICVNCINRRLVNDKTQREQKEKELNNQFQEQRFARNQKEIEWEQKQRENNVKKYYEGLNTQLKNEKEQQYSNRQQLALQDKQLLDKYSAKNRQQEIDNQYKEQAQAYSQMQAENQKQIQDHQKQNYINAQNKKNIDNYQTPFYNKLENKPDYGERQRELDEQIRRKQEILQKQINDDKCFDRKLNEEIDNRTLKYQQQLKEAQNAQQQDFQKHWQQQDNIRSREKVQIWFIINSNYQQQEQELSKRYQQEALQQSVKYQEDQKYEQIEHKKKQQEYYGFIQEQMKEQKLKNDLEQQQQRQSPQQPRPIHDKKYHCFQCQKEYYRNQLNHLQEIHF